MRGAAGCTLFPAHSDTAFRLRPDTHTRKPSPLRPLFTHDITFAKDTDQPRPSSRISLERLTYERFREQKQMLDNAKMPSFQIKRLIDRSTYRRREGRRNECKEGREEKEKGTQRKQLVTQEELKEYWRKYLHSEFATQGTPRTPLSPLPKAKLPDPDPQPTKRQSFFMNNFVRTSSRWNNAKPHLPHQLSLDERRQRIEDSMIQMAPWEEHEEEAQDCFNMR